LLWFLRVCIAYDMATILDDAAAAVHGVRPNDYGHPLDNHTRTAGLWSTYLGRTVSAEDVCLLNVLQKISRGMHSVTRDTLVDIAGYAANVEMIQIERDRRSQLANSGDLVSAYDDFAG